MRQIQKPVFIETLIAKAAIKRLDVCILVWLAWFNQPQRDGARMSPDQQGAATELLPIVGPNHLGEPARRSQLIQDLRHVRPVEGVFRHNGNRLMCRVIHDRQTRNDPAIRTADRPVTKLFMQITE